MTTVPDVVVKPKRKRARKTRDPLARYSASPGAKARASGKPCTRCKQHHVNDKGKPTCNGHKKHIRPYVPCPRPPIKGGSVCPMHGGGNSVVKAKAAMRVTFAQTEGEIAELLRQCDLPEQHPIDGLLEVVRHSGAMMRLLGHLVAQLDRDAGEVGVAISDDGERVTKYSKDTGLYGYNHVGDQSAHVLMLLYGQWSERYARACKLALDANIDERLVRNAEATQNAVYMAVTRALDAADLEPDQQAKFSKKLADELRKLVGPLDAVVGAGHE